MFVIKVHMSAIFVILPFQLGHFHNEAFDEIGWVLRGPKVCHI